MLIIAAILAPACGVAMLRAAWSRAVRSVPLTSAGWVLVVAGAVLGALREGAWGVAVAALGGMGAAAAALGWAAATSPRGNRRAPRERAILARDTAVPLRIGGRLLTFALVALGAAAATGLALMVRALAVRLGSSLADANALTLFVLPLAWATLAYLVLMTHDRRRQVRVLALAVLPVLPLVAASVVP